MANTGADANTQLDEAAVQASPKRRTVLSSGLEPANSRRPPVAGPSPGGTARSMAPPGLGAETWRSPTFG
eukprot:14711435-Alexandrium_andersonii.AAC.1